MAIVTTDDKHYKDIADSIRFGGEVANDESTQKIKLKPSEMAVANRNIMVDCYYYGYYEGDRDGRLLGIEQGIEQGKQAQYDAFWNDVFDTVNSYVTHKFLFAGRVWNDNTFSPTQSLSSKNVEAMFRETCIVDLKGILERNGVTFDFSKATSVDHFAYNSTIQNFPTIDFSSAERINSCFAYLSGDNVSIPLTLKSDGSQKFTSPFANSKGIVNLSITGVIGQGGFDVQWSTKLSKASITSIINALSTTTSGLAVTLSQTAVNNAFTSDEWSALIATKQNWTISLV